MAHNGVLLHRKVSCCAIYIQGVGRRRGRLQLRKGCECIMIDGCVLNTLYIIYTIVVTMTAFSLITTTNKLLLIRSLVEETLPACKTS